MYSPYSFYGHLNVWSAAIKSGKSTGQEDKIKASIIIKKV